MKKLLTLLALIFVGHSLHGADLPPTAKQELIQDFSGGLNTTMPSHKLANNFSPYMRNVFIDNGKIERINGFLALGSTATLTKVTGIYPYVRENGQTTFLITDSSVTLETADFNSWTFVSSGSNTGGLLFWMQVRNKMWGFNGLDSPITWDGLTKVILNGSGSTPNVPKFRFGAYYQDRVWGLGIPGGASDLYYSATITTDNVIIAPDDARAWPTGTNVIYVSRGDGQLGTALWIYQGLLRAGKEQSIYTIYGDNPSNYNPRKEEANVGVISQETVRILDGESIYLERTGIYSNVKRLTDLIQPDIAAINKGVSNIVTNSWNSQPDFLKGQFSGSTVTADGFLTINVSSFTANYTTHTIGNLAINSEAAGSSITLAQGQNTGFVPRISSNTCPGNFLLWPYTISFIGYCPTGGCGQLTLTLRNTRTGLSQASISNPFGSGWGATLAETLELWGNETVFTNKQNVLFSGDDINSGNMTYKLDYTGTGNTWIIFPASTTGFSNWSMYAASTGSFISDISTLAMVTAWGNFDSVRTTNGGTINFYLHSSTSLVNITTKTWTPVVPGSVIGEPTINNFIQWTTTLTCVGPCWFGTPSSNIDNVTISHIEGQSSDARAFAMDWLNRYWITVTTTSNSTLRLTYVKSKTTNATPDAWMPIEGIPLDSYAKVGSILYGGSASSGTVFRLDYGTNFNGQPINSYYDTPDLILGDYFFDKYIYKYLIDGTKSAGGTLTVRSSINGFAFTSSTFSISGTGRYIHIIEGVTKPIKTLRLRLQNGETDVGLGINNVNILYEPRSSLSNQ